MWWRNLRADGAFFGRFAMSEVGSWFAQLERYQTTAVPSVESSVILSPAFSKTGSARCHGGLLWNQLPPGLAL